VLLVNDHHHRSVLSIDKLPSALTNMHGAKPCESAESLVRVCKCKLLLQVWEMYRFRNGQDRALNIDFAYGGRLLSKYLL